MAANLQLVISGVDKASGVLNNIEKNAGGLSKTVGTVLKAGFVVGAAGMGIATVAGYKFVKAAMEEEAGINRLAAAVDASGGSWAKQGASIEMAIRQREKLAFSDDDLRSSLSMLTAQTGDVDEAMRRQVVAMDLARGAGIDLGSASKLLGKVTDESHAALSRMGITIDKNASATEVLEAVQKRFSGQSAAFADSAAGKWAQFGNQLQNLKEVIGAALLPVVTLLGGALVDLATWAIPKVEELAIKLVEMVTPVAIEGIGLLKGAFIDFKDTLITIAESSVFKGFLDGINEGLGNIRDVAIVAKDTVIEAFGKIDEILKNVPGLDKLTKGMGNASKDAEGAKNVGKLFTEAAAGLIAFSVATSTLDTSINIIGNSLGALAGVIVTIATVELAVLLPIIAVVAALAAMAAGAYLIEKRTQFFSKDVLPALKDLASWIETKVIPAFEKFAETELIPRLKDFGDWLQSDFLPVVKHAAQIFH